MEETSAAMKQFRALTDEMARQRNLMTEGFCRAFIDATGLHPQDAEMVVQTVHSHDSISDSLVLTEKIWFQRRVR